MERVVQHLRRLQVGVVIIASSEGGTWRTRHLRLRAAKLRDVLEAEPWVERWMWHTKMESSSYAWTVPWCRRLHKAVFKAKDSKVGGCHYHYQCWGNTQGLESSFRLHHPTRSWRMKGGGPSFGSWELCWVSWASNNGQNQGGALILAVVALRRRQRKRAFAKSLCLERTRAWCISGDMRYVHLMMLLVTKLVICRHTCRDSL